ncbi:MAG: transposase, family [Polaromonas sp.]|nr:transposase, family [Polaromonas sp.]
MPGNPYDGHTLHETIEQVEILADNRPGMAVVDKGYRGAQVQGVQILRSGQRRGIPNPKGNDQAAKRHRADHWAYENGRPAG